MKCYREMKLWILIEKLWFVIEKWNRDMKLWNVIEKWNRDMKLWNVISKTRDIILFVCLRKVWGSSLSFFYHHHLPGVVPCTTLVDSPFLSVSPPFSQGLCSVQHSPTLLLELRFPKLRTRSFRVFCWLSKGRCCIETYVTRKWVNPLGGLN
jgi:hypothetical protein